MGGSSRGRESSQREEKEDPLRLSSSSLHSWFDTKVRFHSPITLLVICYVFDTQLYIIYFSIIGIHSQSIKCHNFLNLISRD